MNRAMRRERERAHRLLGVLTATATCDDCGSPICPACNVEATYCDDCGSHHCESCGRYVQVGHGAEQPRAQNGRAS